MRLGDGIVGLGIVLFAGGVLWHVRGFPTLPGQFYGPGFFPAVVLTGLLACGAVLVARGARQAFDRGFGLAVPIWCASPRGAISTLVGLASVLAFYFLGEDIGFAPLTFVVLLI